MLVLLNDYFHMVSLQLSCMLKLFSFTIYYGQDHLSIKNLFILVNIFHVSVVALLLLFTLFTMF